jgi:beta-glucosidase
VAPELYLGLPSAPGVSQPLAQLKGFRKVMLAPGRQTRVSFALNARALSYWDTALGDWRVAEGCYRVMVGNSSRDLPLRGAFARAGGRCPRSANASR